MIERRLRQTSLSQVLYFQSVVLAKNASRGGLRRRRTTPRAPTRETERRALAAQSFKTAVVCP